MWFLAVTDTKISGAINLDRINKDGLQGKTVAMCVGRKEGSMGFAKNNSWLLSMAVSSPGKVYC